MLQNNLLQKNLNKDWQEHLSPRWQTDSKGWGRRSLYSLQAALNTQYKAFFLILNHLGGFWQKASEPSDLEVLCLATKKVPQDGILAWKVLKTK